MIGENIDGAAAEPYSVICHGDCWNNNIMYRYEVRHIESELRGVRAD
jgi:hypothetical protein